MFSLAVLDSCTPRVYKTPWPLLPSPHGRAKAEDEIRKRGEGRGGEADIVLKWEHLVA